MKHLLYLPAALILLAAGTGCDKTCSQFDICSISQGNYNSAAIIGYYAADVDTQIILSYRPDGLFDQFIDSARYINREVTGGTIYNKSDTQALFIGYTGGAFNSQRINDFKLMLPGVRTYLFTEVMADGEFAKDDEFKCSRGSSGCRRRVTSMKIDGVYHDFPDYHTPLVLYK